MPKATEYSPDKRIFALHISRSGDGKSAAAASYPHPYHQFDFDDRFDGVWGALKPQGFIDDAEGVSYDTLYPHHGYVPFQDKITELEMLHIARQFPYKTIEIASATALVEAFITTSHKAQGGRVIGAVTKNGKSVGGLRVSGPGDFNFEVTAMRQTIGYLHTLPCHIIMSAHIIDKWGKPRPKDTDGEMKSIADMSKEETDKFQYASNEIVGEQLLLRDKVGEVVLSLFSNVFRFSRELDGNKMKYYVEFATDIAKNAFGIPPGRFDITGKPFYPYLQDLILRIRSGEDVRPKGSGGFLNL